MKMSPFTCSGIWLPLSGWWGEVRPQRLSIVKGGHCQASTVQVQQLHVLQMGNLLLTFFPPVGAWSSCAFLTRFTETETHMEVFSLHVDIMEPECSIIKLGPKSLEVPEFYGLSDVVDGNVVSFHYERRSSLECSIHLSGHDTHLPAHGQLVTGEPERAMKRGDEPESFIHLRQQLGKLWKCMADRWWKIPHI